eukprot:496859-Lingulodinium_polyedra.AAC.1
MLLRCCLGAARVLAWVCWGTVRRRNGVQSAGREHQRKQILGVRTVRATRTICKPLRRRIIALNSF